MAENSGETVQVSWKSKITGVTGQGSEIPVDKGGITEEGVKSLKETSDKLAPDVEHTVIVRTPVGKGNRGIRRLKVNP